MNPWKMQERCKNLAAQAVVSATKIHEEASAALLSQGTLEQWRQIYVQLEGLADSLNDLENNLTAITGVE